MLTNLFTILLAPLLAPLLALAAPTTQAPQKRFSESTPWHLRDLQIGTPAPNTNASATLTFTFCDSNAGLELETLCSRTTAPGFNASVVDPQDYYTCANNSVGFRFDGGRIDVQRTYIDASVGPYPYWFVTAFGSANTSFETKDTASGTLQVEKRVEVPVTALIA